MKAPLFALRLNELLGRAVGTSRHTRRTGHAKETTHSRGEVVGDLCPFYLDESFLL
jgi:hypothetical protein